MQDFETQASLSGTRKYNLIINTNKKIEFLLIVFFVIVCLNLLIFNKVRVYQSINTLPIINNVSKKTICCLQYDKEKSLSVTHYNGMLSTCAMNAENDVITLCVHETSADDPSLELLVNARSSANLMHGC